MNYIITFLCTFFVASTFCFSQNEELILDSLYKEQEKLDEIKMNYITSSDSVILESNELRMVKPGFYCRTLPYYDDHGEFYNEIEWIYIDESYNVQLFISANYEYCLMNMYFAKKPKQIRRQINKNHEKFIQLYLDCMQGQMYVPSKKIDDKTLVLNPKDEGMAFNDKIWFIKGGIIRRTITNCINYETFNYKYVGK